MSPQHLAFPGTQVAWPARLIGVSDARLATLEGFVQDVLAFSKFGPPSAGSNGYSWWPALGQASGRQAGAAAAAARPFQRLPGGDRVRPESFRQFTRAATRSRGAAGSIAWSIAHPGHAARRRQASLVEWIGRYANILFDGSPLRTWRAGFARVI